MTSFSSHHTLHESIKFYLEPTGYYIFFLYKQYMNTRLTGRPQLRRRKCGARLGAHDCAEHAASSDIP